MIFHSIAGSDGARVTREAVWPQDISAGSAAATGPSGRSPADACSCSL